MKTIIDLFTKNLGWKLVSLLISVTLWFVGMNINNPTRTDTFEVPLTIQGADMLVDDRLVLLNEADLLTQTISVRIRATRDDLLNLEREKRFMKAYIDLRPIDVTFGSRVGEYLPVTVEVDLPPSLNSSRARFDIIGITPNKADILLDKFVTQQHKVMAYPLGDVMDGYVAMSPIVVPDYVSVSGAKTILDTIETVRVDVNTKDASNDVTQKSKPIVYDTNKQDISAVTLSTELVEVSIPIHKLAKIDILPRIVGTLPAGYKVTNIIVEPSYLEVVGSQEEIDAMPTIDLEAISLDRTYATITREFDLRAYLMATNLTIRNGTPYIAQVTIEIDRDVTKDFKLSSRRIKVTGSPESYELPSEVTVKLKGPAAAIDSIKESDLNVSADLTGLAEGVHSVGLNVNFVEGLAYEAFLNDVSNVSDKISVKINQP